MRSTTVLRPHPVAERMNADPRALADDTLHRLAGWLAAVSAEAAGGRGVGTTPGPSTRSRGQSR
jgi:hypothetical protein